MCSAETPRLLHPDPENEEETETNSLMTAIRPSTNFDNTGDSVRARDKWQRRRNLIGFWILGLCNNFAYVVMLSAAHDILKDEETMEPIHNLNTTSTTSALSSNKTEYLQCNNIGTGAILLADIVPALIIKLSGPLFVEYISYRLKINLVASFAAASFLIVAFSKNVVTSLIGVACASVSSGMGEITLLAYSSFYPRDVVSTWSSGTGGAGIFGSLVYAGITGVGLSARNTVLLQTIVPVIMLISFYFILHKPEPVISPDSDTTALLDEKTEKSLFGPKTKFTLKQKLYLLLPLLKYVLPLLTVYFAEYFINQGLLELLYFNNTWLNPAAQYRWYQVVYQLGVFISRSSVNCIQIRKLWILSLLQFANLIFLLYQVFYHFIPSVWVVVVVILYEGLLGGAAYVNTFYRMSIEVPAKSLEYSLGVVSVSDTLGISIAGLIAVPTHNSICSLNIKM